MHRFTECVQIHRACCKLIAAVAFHMDSKRKLITETTVKSVLKSMELFPLDVDIQIIVCGTISCIVQKIAILKHELIGHGGIGLIKKAVDNHPKDPRVAVMTLMALGHVLPIDSSTYPMEKQMIFDLILPCMKNFSENKETQLAGCQALSKCGMLGDLSDDLTDTVLRALRRHGEDTEIQRKAANALKIANNNDFSSMLRNTLTSFKIVVTEEFWRVFNG